MITVCFIAGATVLGGIIGALIMAIVWGICHGLQSADFCEDQLLIMVVVGAMIGLFAGVVFGGFFICGVKEAQQSVQTIGAMVPGLPLV